MAEMLLGIIIGLLTGVLVVEALRLPFPGPIGDPVRFALFVFLAIVGVLFSAFVLDRAGLPEEIHFAVGDMAALKLAAFLGVVGLFARPIFSGIVESLSSAGKSTGKFLVRRVLPVAAGTGLLVLFLKAIEDPKVNESAAGAIAMVLVAAVLFYRFRTKKKS